MSETEADKLRKNLRGVICRHVDAQILASQLIRQEVADVLSDEAWAKLNRIADPVEAEDSVGLTRKERRLVDTLNIKGALESHQKRTGSTAAQAYEAVSAYECNPSGLGLLARCIDNLADGVVVFDGSKEAGAVAKRMHALARMVGDGSIFDHDPGPACEPAPSPDEGKEDEG